MIIPRAASISEAFNVRYHSYKDANELAKQIHNVFIEKIAFRNQYNVLTSPDNKAEEKIKKEIFKEAKEMKNNFAKIKPTIQKCYSNFLDDIKNTKLKLRNIKKDIE